MKNTKTLSILTSSLIVAMLLNIACGPSNSAPTVPTLTSPADNEACAADSNGSFEFAWETSVDEDGDAITYDIDIAKDASFTDIVYDDTEVTETSSKTDTLDKNTTYYWRVRASDGESDSEYATRSFTTEPEPATNEMPTIETLPESPENGYAVSGPNVTLSWTAADDADGDSLTYDVYFGTSKPSSAVDIIDNLPKTWTEEEKGLSVTEWTMEGLDTGYYYWFVVATDSNGNANIGPIWSFSVN